MMRLIDADALMGMVFNDVVLIDGDVKGAGLILADAVVVRCKECEHAERYERTDGTAGYYCGHPQNTFVYGERWNRLFKPAKEADDFCSSGERKEGAEC